MTTINLLINNVPAHCFAGSIQDHGNAAGLRYEAKYYTRMAKTIGRLADIVDGQNVKIRTLQDQYCDYIIFETDDKAIAAELRKVVR